MRLKKLVSLTAAAAVALAVLPLQHAEAFGTFNGLGQAAEHERITRVLGRSATDIKVSNPFQPASLDMLAGKRGVLGGVGSPDNPFDSSIIPVVGLGPGYKHCDDADFADVPGYPQSRADATDNLMRCVNYYNDQLDRAVKAAGDIVDQDLVVSQKQMALNCSFPFKPATSGSAKCRVLNRLGRALHTAEDFWSHSNWADVAAAGPLTAQNPAGLARTDIPAFFRYPLPSSYAIPRLLSTGCDDSADPFGVRCKDRVAHSVLAKDNGEVDPNTGIGTPTSKYTRGTINNNFQRAVTGARKQAVSTWSDLQRAIISAYGQERGDLIIRALIADTLTSCDLGIPLKDGQLPCIGAARATSNGTAYSVKWTPGAPTSYRVRLTNAVGTALTKWITVAVAGYEATVRRWGSYVLQIQGVKGTQVTPVYREPFVVGPAGGQPPSVCATQTASCVG